MSRFLLLIVLVPALWAQSGRGQRPSTTTLYNCDENYRFRVRFGGAGNAALVTLPDGQSYSLTPVESASGAAFSNGFWRLNTKGQEATLERSGTIIARNCRGEQEVTGPTWGKPNLDQTSTPDSGAPLQMQWGEEGWQPTLRVGQTMELRLNAGRSWDAYRWSPIYQQNDSVQVEFDEAASRNNAAHLFRIRALKPGGVVIEFRYERRNWGGEAPDKTRRLVVLVQ